ncbi:MAG: cytochrome c [Gammaproteobacteria bacterium]
MRSFGVMFTVLLAGSSFARAAGGDRWYSANDVERGREIFAANCAVCHGDKGQGSTRGALTAPPLNGGGHSTHHGLDYLLDQVTNGGARQGGKMPAFGAVLNETERRAAIAWVQTLWPDEAYRSWQQMHRSGHR